VSRCLVSAFLLPPHAAQTAPRAQRLLALGHAGYTHVRPALDWVDGGSPIAIDRTDVVRSRLKAISWATWFGPGTVPC
jgi:hypothetical protein